MVSHNLETEMRRRIVDGNKTLSGFYGKGLHPSTPILATPPLKVLSYIYGYYGALDEGS